MIIQDIRGFKKLVLESNNQKIVQSSMYAVQSWRANCDIQNMLYDSDPTEPNPQEIAKITDYIVSYQTKATETQIEQKSLIQYVMQIRKVKYIAF